MRVRLLAFASASQALGTSEREWELAEGSDLAALARSLEAGVPALAPTLSRLAFAVDGELARPDTPLHDGSEVALLPPVSGG